MTIPIESTGTINANPAKRLYNRLKWLAFGLVCLELSFCLILIEITEIDKTWIIPDFLLFLFGCFVVADLVLWLIVIIWSAVLVKLRALWLLLGAPFILVAAYVFLVVATWINLPIYCNAQPLRKLYTVDHNGHLVYLSMVPACAGP